MRHFFAIHFGSFEIPAGYLAKDTPAKIVLSHSTRVLVPSLGLRSSDNYVLVGYRFHGSSKRRSNTTGKGAHISRVSALYPKVLLHLHLRPRKPRRRRAIIWQSKLETLLTQNALERGVCLSTTISYLVQTPFTSATQFMFNRPSFGLESQHKAI